MVWVGREAVSIDRRREGYTPHVLEMQRSTEICALGRWEVMQSFFPILKNVFFS